MKFRSSHSKKSHSLRGAFITFEGTEGSGKSTQCRVLARFLRGQGYHVLETREPGGTPLAERIRKLMLTRVQPKGLIEPITPTCEAMLIFAARAQHIAHVIQPALKKGMIVVCDRFFDSTMAYQGYARGLDKTLLTQTQLFISNTLQPHLTFFLDLPIQEGLSRRQQSKKQDRLDRESLAFHQRVHHGFISLAKQHPTRIKKVDARQSPQTLATHIATIVNEMICHTKSLDLIRSSGKQ